MSGTTSGTTRGPGSDAVVDRSVLADRLETLRNRFEEFRGRL